MTLGHRAVVPPWSEERQMMQAPQERFALSLPDVSAPVETTEDNLRRIFRLSQGSAQDEPTDFADRKEAHDTVARLTVYALNGSVMLFSFPVGFGLLIFNILGGENLRTTAHTMALTGMGTSLVSAGWAAQALGL